MDYVKNTGKPRKYRGGGASNVKRGSGRVGGGSGGGSGGGGGFSGGSGAGKAGSSGNSQNINLFFGGQGGGGREMLHMMAQPHPYNPQYLPINLQAQQPNPQMMAANAAGLRVDFQETLNLSREMAANVAALRQERENAALNPVLQQQLNDRITEQQTSITNLAGNIRLNNERVNTSLGQIQAGNHLNLVGAQHNFEVLKNQLDMTNTMVLGNLVQNMPTGSGFRKPQLPPLQDILAPWQLTKRQSDFVELTENLIPSRAATRPWPVQDPVDERVNELAALIDGRLVLSVDPSPSPSQMPDDPVRTPPSPSPSQMLTQGTGQPSMPRELSLIPSSVPYDEAGAQNHFLATPEISFIESILIDKKQKPKAKPKAKPASLQVPPPPPYMGAAGGEPKAESDDVVIDVDEWWDENQREKNQQGLLGTMKKKFQEIFSPKSNKVVDSMISSRGDPIPEFLPPLMFSSRGGSDRTRYESIPNSAPRLSGQLSPMFNDTNTSIQPQTDGGRPPSMFVDETFGDEVANMRQPVINSLRPPPPPDRQPFRQPIFDPVEESSSPSTNIIDVTRSLNELNFRG